MTAVLSVSDSSRVIRASSDLSRAYWPAVRNVPRKHQSRAAQCAAHLYAQGLLGDNAICGESMSDIREAAKDELQRVGLLPTGLVWVLSIVLRAAMSAFIARLIDNWLAGGVVIGNVRRTDSARDGE